MRLFLTSLFIVSALFLVPTVWMQEECFGEYECYDFDEDECFGEFECYDFDDNPDQDSVWDGYTDGRLDPDPAEYYSVWCNADMIEVWRSVPSTERLQTIPILDAINIRGLGAGIDLGDTMQIVRLSETLFGIFGSNGNLAPQSGEKVFDMTTCIERNGGLPEAAPAPTPATVVQAPPPPTSTPVPPPPPSQTGINWMAMFSVLMQACLFPSMLSIVIAPGMFSSWRRKRRR